MGVVKPGFHLASPKDLPEMRDRLKGKGGRRKIHEELTLTALIDMFSTIILFLITHFSATGEIMLINKDIKLPEATYAKELKRAPIVTVMADKIVLEGLVVGDNKGLTANLNNAPTAQKEEFTWDLPILAARLEEYKKFFESVLPGEKFPGEIIVQADKKLDFVYVKRIMYTLTKIGFGNVMLAVRGEAKPEEPKAL